MTHGFTPEEKNYLWDNTKCFFYLSLGEFALIIGALVSVFILHPFWKPLAVFAALCAIAGATFCLYNIHLRQLALNIFNQRSSSKNATQQQN